MEKAKRKSRRADKMKYKPSELILSIIYYSQGQYTVDEIIELVELIALYEGDQPKDKRNDLNVVQLYSPVDDYE